MSEYTPSNKDELDEVPVEGYWDKANLDDSESDRTADILNNG